MIARNRARVFVGAKATVLDRLGPMIEATKADEVMVTTMIYDHAARRHSYELLAEAFGLRTTESRCAGSVALLRRTREIVPRRPAVMLGPQATFTGGPLG